MSIKFRIWVDHKETPYLGIGRIVLLEKILEYGSITRGAEAINMSYRKAWQLVENMNATANSPLVEKRLGGKKGSGATVTSEGKRVIKEFYKLHSKINHYIQELTSEIPL